MLLAASFVLARVALLPVLPVPDPEIHDEFSYLLAADTFAHGRLANPAVTQPEFFEAPHVLLSPSYASKYPPGQGLALAFGQKYLGDPYWGVVLSGALMIFLFCWAADAWLPPQWTLIAGGLSWILFFIGHYWLTSYWGGNVAACGGALMVGGLGRVSRGYSTFGRFSLAAGAIILYLTRPYEGGVLGLLILGILAVHMWLLSGPKKQTLLRVVLLPNAFLMAAAVPLAAYYNAAVTGHATELPDVVHMQQYDSVPAFWFLPPYPEKHYHTESNRYVWARAREAYDRLHEASPRRLLMLQSRSIVLGGIVRQFLGFGLLLFGLPWARIHGKTWLMVLFAGWAATLFPEVWAAGHYSAPFTAVHLILIVGTGRTLWYRVAAVRWRAIVLPIAFLLAFAPLGVLYAGALQDHSTDRGRLIRSLKSMGGNHLVFVEYSKGWNFEREWVYNGADLASSRVLFVHSRSDHENRELMERYSGRTTWRLHLGPQQSDVRVERYDAGQPGLSSAATLSRQR